MAARFAALASGILLTACSAVGVRTVEEPPYRKVAQLGPVEIRNYGPRLAAETMVGGGEIDARSAGFRRLAAYIFGANRSSAGISMTAPVAQAPDTSGSWSVRFFMPARYTSASLPEPLSRDVRIVTVPGQTVAVLRYSGVATKSAVRKATGRLFQALAGSGWDADGTPTAWFYDPPWTIPPLRRNEAVVLVSRHPHSG